LDKGLFIYNESRYEKVSSKRMPISLLRRISVNLLDHIMAIPLFEGLSRGQHEALARITLNRSYRKGQAIFSEGDEGVGFYAIISGRVKIFKLSPEGKEQILHMMGTGEIFGEVPVFTGQEYPANAEAHINSSLLFFPKNSFIELVKKRPVPVLKDVGPVVVAS
jgi:CRP/FNR family transcriptional regulator